jgi:hypothetical protein
MFQVFTNSEGSIKDPHSVIGGHSALNTVVLGAWGYVKAPNTPRTSATIRDTFSIKIYRS